MTELRGLRRYCREKLGRAGPRESGLVAALLAVQQQVRAARFRSLPGNRGPCEWQEAGNPERQVMVWADDWLCTGGPQGRRKRGAAGEVHGACGGREAQ